MSKYQALAFCCAVGVLFLAAPTRGSAVDDDEVVKTVNGDLLKEMLEDEGYKGVTVDKSSKDLHVVRMKMDGKEIVIFCNLKLGDILCRFAISGTQANARKINAWNDSKRFFKAHLDKDGEPAFEHILVVKHGVTVKAVKAHVGLMELGVKAFLKEVCD